MADSVANLVLRILAVNQTGPAFAGVRAGLAGLRGEAGLAAGALGAGVAAGTVSAIKHAADFQRTMAQTAALTGQKASDIGASNQQMAQGFVGTSRQVLDAVNTTGQSAQQLGEALYFIASSGFTKAADAAKIMTLSGKDATIGHVDAKVAADALTTSLNAYGAGADQAAKYNDTLLQGVNLGKAEFGDFARSLGSVLPLASQAGISFQNITSALATLTLSGLSPRRAAMDLNRLIQSILAPTKGQVQMGAALGIDFSKVNLSTPQGLLTFLEQVRSKVSAFPKGEQAQIFKHLFGNQAAILGAQVLTNNIGNLSHNMDVMNRTVGHGAVTNRAYAAVSGTLAVQVQTLRNRIGAAAIALGGQLSPVALRLVHVLGALLPGAVRVLSALIHGILHPTAAWRAAFSLLGTVVHSTTATLRAIGTTIGQIIGWVGRLLPPVHASHAAFGQARAAAAGLGTALGILIPVVAGYIGVSRTVKLVTDAWKFAQVALNVVLSINPIVAITIAVAALVVGVIWAYKNVGWFHTLVNKVWAFLSGTFGPALHSLAGFLGGAFSAAWRTVSRVAQGAWHDLHVIWTLIDQNLGPVVRGLASTLSGAFSQGWKDVQDAAQNMWSLLQKVWDWLNNTLKLDAIGQGIKDTMGGAFDFVKKQIDDFMQAFQKALGFIGGLVAHIPGFDALRKAIATAEKTVDAHRATQRRHTAAGGAGTADLSAMGHEGAGAAGAGAPSVHHHSGPSVHHHHGPSTHHGAGGIDAAHRRKVDDLLSGKKPPHERTPEQGAILDFSTAMKRFLGQKGLDPTDVARMAHDIAAIAATDPARAANLQASLENATRRRHEAIAHHGAVAEHHRQVLSRQQQHHLQQQHQREQHHQQQQRRRETSADAATLLRAIHNEIREHRFAQAARDITRFRGLETTALRAAGLDPTRAAREAGVIARGLQDELARAERAGGRAGRPVTLQDAVDHFKTDLLTLGTSARDHARLIADVARVKADEIAAHYRGARVAYDVAENMHRVDEHFKIAAAARLPVAPVPRYGALAGETGYGQTTVSFGGAQANPWQSMVAALREQITHLRAQLAKDDQLIALLEVGNATAGAELGELRSLHGTVRTPPPPQPAHSVNSHLKARGGHALVGRP